MRRIVLSLVSIATLLCHAPAEAVAVVVSPGTGTLQTAIDNAAPGDTLKLQTGYTGAVTVDKSLRIIGPRLRNDPFGATIDAECSAATAVDVAADEVRLQRVTVRGGTLYTIDIDGRTGVRLKQVVPVQGAFGCGAVEYGINVFNSSDVQIVDCTVIGDNNGYTGPYGYQDAGIYIGGIPSDGKVSIKKGLVVGNNRGIIIEDSAPVSPGSIRVQKIGLASNDTGIFVHNWDGVLIAKNTVNDARGSTPAVGIELDGTSDDNLVKKNSCSGAVTVHGPAIRRRAFATFRPSSRPTVLGRSIAAAAILT